MCEQENGSAHDKMPNKDDVTLPDDLSESDDSEPEEEPTSMPFDTELKDLDSSDDDDDDDDDEVEINVAPASGQRAQSSFSLKGGSSGFSSRSHSIFESLDSVAKLTSSALGQDNVIDGVFARPPPPPPLISSKAGKPLPRSSASGGKRGVPDYLVHPERWTRYSLEDVAETSNSQNSMVAHQYLASLQQRKQQQEPSSPHLNQGRNTSSSQQKIIFSRPSQPGREQPADELKVAGDRDRSTSLRHLEEEEDEEEEMVEGARAMARRMDRFKEDSMGKSKERGKGSSHLDQEDEEEEERRSATRPPEAEERKRKWGQQGGGVEEEAEEEKKNQQANPGFVFFRKTNRKKYRKSSEQDND